MSVGRVLDVYISFSPASTQHCKTSLQYSKKSGLLLSAYTEACSIELQTPPKSATTAVDTCRLARVAWERDASPAATLGSQLPLRRCLQRSEQNCVCQETLVRTAVIQQRGGDIWKTVQLKEL